MGFGSASKYLIWTASPLHIKHVKVICNSKTCLIDVDMSWILRKLGIGLTQQMQVKLMAQFLRTLAKDGLIITPICDNKCRHHSKRDSISRQFQREKNRVDGLFARCKGISLSTQIRKKGGRCTDEEDQQR